MVHEILKYRQQELEQFMNAPNASKRYNATQAVLLFVLGAIALLVVYM